MCKGKRLPSSNPDMITTATNPSRERKTNTKGSEKTEQITFFFVVFALLLLLSNMCYYITRVKRTKAVNSKGINKNTTFTTRVYIRVTDIVKKTKKHRAQNLGAI